MHVSPISSQECPSTEELALCLEQVANPDTAITAHIESCSSCQNILEWIAGDETFWEQAKQSLSVTAFDHNQYKATTRIVESICAMSQPSGPTELDPLCKHEIQQMTSMLEPASHPELLGRIGRYELEQLVGRGGMGLVFRAYDTELYRVVAVKTLAIHLIPMQAARERFVREGRACASLIHPHIVPVHDVITDGPVPALVMQYVAGPSLEQHIRDQGPLPLEQSLQLMEQLCEALIVAHEKGFVHRDIKPGNVLLEVDGSRALLTDFGLVRTLDDATITRSGMLAGTPEYMSPEQARGEAVDKASDMFSLGSLFYCMLAGHAPFQAVEPMAVMNQICHAEHTPIRELQAYLPEPVGRLLDRLLDKNPKTRLGSANELRGALAEIRIAKAAPAPTSLSFVQQIGSKPGWLSALAVVTILVSAGIMASTSMWNGNRRSDVEALQTQVDALESDVFGDDVSESFDPFLSILEIDDEIEHLDGQVQQVDLKQSAQFNDAFDFLPDGFDRQLNQVWMDLESLEAELR